MFAVANAGLRPQLAYLVWWFTPFKARGKSCRRLGQRNKNHVSALQESVMVCKMF
jgi:hypothetical protein